MQSHVDIPASLMPEDAAPLKITVKGGASPKQSSEVLFLKNPQVFFWQNTFMCRHLNSKLVALPVERLNLKLSIMECGTFRQAFIGVRLMMNKGKKLIFLKNIKVTFWSAPYKTGHATG